MGEVKRGRWDRRDLSGAGEDGGPETGPSRKTDVTGTRSTGAPTRQVRLSGTELMVESPPRWDRGSTLTSTEGTGYDREGAGGGTTPKLKRLVDRGRLHDILNECITQGTEDGGLLLSDIDPDREYYSRVIYKH